jgi:N-acetyl-D-muramate 6-phosphate phosphatase
VSTALHNQPVPTLVRPKAVLLDHGGVIARSVKRPERVAALAQHVHDMIVAAGGEVLPVADIHADIRAGRAAYKAWKNGNGRRMGPREIRHRELWEEFIAADWPTSARTLVGVEATPLCRILVTESEKHLAEGMRDLFELCEGRGIKVGIVSNTLIGAANREHARVWGTEKYFAVQVHSDEVGIRKPDPEMILTACRALGLDPADCWYVGDNYDRDVLCGRRAGVGCAVLMRPQDRLDPAARPQPDLVVHDGVDLVEALRQVLAREEEGR